MMRGQRNIAVFSGSSFPRQSFNNPVALNFVRRREIVQWLTPILRATCVTAIPASSLP